MMTKKRTGQCPVQWRYLNGMFGPHCTKDVHSVDERHEGREHGGRVTW